ncbi:type IV secretory system conjugative DNA transfer family protein [Facilibium subflavum]|uniref:type IV secretory system conjugative DNA transfer family protein n=1 Tax=Facilibium subflavum TaxID=2219058 RepID=UPI000E64C128|nr:type IV secretory system conjugative DNA transfer family protein [Facilibium subflavum]
MAVVDLAQLENLDAKSVIIADGSAQLSLRLQAIQQAALELGIQSGLYKGQTLIERALDRMAPMLYQSYNFNALTLQNNILPPVIETGYNQSNVSANARKVTVNGQVYHIVKQAHFVSNVPTWRDYLITGFTKPAIPDRSVLPQNDTEKTLWKKEVQYGWQQGIVQACDIFKQNMHRLNRDFRGMIMYYQLVNRDMMLPPYVHSQSKAIVHNSDNLSIDNHLLDLQVLPQFQSNASRWQAILKPLAGKIDAK